MEAGKARESPGPDSRWSWVVAGFLAWVMATSTLSSRAMGVFYVGIVEHFDVSREEATWPLSLHSTSFCMAAAAFQLSTLYANHFMCSIYKRVQPITNCVQK
ncbi:hypothetical protein IscW_ISCW005449 [Ixodes scapularis]|uniref:Monocarboxylate transporter n=1 Tax=Ixodes scapularis TaxID=6945 RepID=B7PRA2_IXOSC|nr:hypothetical protein IscW_ISCW005449 [Ixodes scapularis]|eukprot:XP_002436294.1 hypothetical protein IscW_ISCW005449 [Ixodes scapularis]